MIKKILLVLIIVLIAIQFIRPQKNVHPARQTAHISTIYAVPADVDTILAKACNDCHSNNTRYPWYNNIQPVAWWLNDHIVEGKKEINFSEFATYRIGRQYRKLDEVIKQVKQDEMPLSSYTLIHRNAILTLNHKLAITNWAAAIRGTIKANYPPDSLIIKRPSREPK